MTERDFIANEQRRLASLSALIDICGLSNGDIARECNLDRRTVSAARRGLAIRSDATERIAFYLRTIYSRQYEQRTITNTRTEGTDEA